jgi:membrane-bound ClpP family serine protease
MKSMLFILASAFLLLPYVRMSALMSLAAALISLVAGALCVAAVWIALLSRHQKAATRRLKLVEMVAVVETTLEPEGAVLVCGELWRARSRAALRVERGERVRVVGAGGHLLEVEPLSLGSRE